ncbi:MAG TPA: FkbM family methyltransferase [Pirellulales bacterium]|jgi:FkbM family methyltransferase|nr:FkbM family methyltransferase [Pirellulales bacterium]
MMRRARQIAKTLLPRRIADYLRDRRTKWQIPDAVRAFETIRAEEPIAFYSIGARNGADPVETYFRRRGKMKIIGVEPEPAEAAKLLADATLDHVLPTALGAEDGAGTLQVTRQIGCSSLLEPHAENLAKLCVVPEWFEVQRRLPVEVRRLDRLVAEFRLPPPDMMEIDVQGYEYQVLEGCGELLSAVGSLSLELHFQQFYREQKTFAEVHAWLYSKGFHLAQLKRGLKGDTLVEVDALFYNRRLIASSARAAATLRYWRDRYRHRWRRAI